MTSGLLGALIALLWGVHDFLVRFVSREVGPVYALVCVLIGGAALLSVYVALQGMTLPESGEGWMLAGLTGGALALASLWLYRAFAIGPVYLVAPVICAYPVLSVSWAFLRGAEARLLDLVAIVAVIGGVVLVAATATDEERRGPDEAAPAAGGRLKALIYAGLACVCFAATFALGQAAAGHAGEWAVTWIARLAAIMVIVPLCIGLRPPVSAIRRWWPVLLLMGLLDVLAVAGVVLSGGMADPSHAAVTSSTFGAVTILLAWTLLRERIKPVQWLGILATFAGIAFLSARV